MPADHQMIIGLVQMQGSADLGDAVRCIRKAASRGARIVCLQELFRSRYFCQEEKAEYFSLAETVPGPATETLCPLAAELEIVIIAPLFEKRAEGIYHNTAVVIDADGSIAGKYRKMHIPDDPCFYEKFYFTPGDTGFESFATRYGKVGVLICWDQWFPEAARLCALSGAHVLFYPTAIGFQEIDAEEAKKQHSAWETMQRSHAIANGIFVAAVNRAGQEDALRFWGQSFVCDPFGEVIARAGADEDEVLIAECDLGKIEETRQHWPFFRDRRTDAYQDITRLYRDKND
ncbi:MAG: carbon-nitrogen hydrolase [Nitrospinota bacterium]|nr:carbon-nitrogen hydrolase [Nitrospinota bacterium]